MNTEDLWQLWCIMSEFIPNKEKESAVEEYLNYVYDLDCCDIFELRDMADDEEDTLFSKIASRFIKENELYEDEY